MIELTKAEKKLAKELIKKGILKRHAEWHREIRELLDRPFDDEIRNEFGKSMILTDKARKFFKEAMWMEDFYRRQRLVFGLRELFQEGYLTAEDVAVLPDDLRERVTEQDLFLDEEDEEEPNDTAIQNNPQA